MTYDVQEVLQMKFTIANTRKAATKSGSMIDNELRSPKILDMVATNLPPTETILMSHFIFLQETISKQGEEIMALMKTTNYCYWEWGKMVVKLEDEIRECKHTSWKTDERFN